MFEGRSFRAVCSGCAFRRARGWSLGRPFRRCLPAAAGLRGLPGASARSCDGRSSDSETVRAGRRSDAIGLRNPEERCAVRISLAGCQALDWTRRLAIRRHRRTEVELKGLRRERTPRALGSSMVSTGGAAIPRVQRLRWDRTIGVGAFSSGSGPDRRPVFRPRSGLGWRLLLRSGRQESLSQVAVRCHRV